MSAVTTAERCRALVRAAFPDLTAERIRFLAEGWDSTAFEVETGDQVLVFRFPKRAAVESSLLMETRLLPVLASWVRLPIPGFRYAGGPVLDYPFHFAGYRMLPGVPLPVAAPDESILDVLAPSLGRFLRALHAFPVERAAALGVPVFTPDAWIDRHRRLFETAREAAVGALDALTARRFKAYWREALGNPAMRLFRPALVHGDLAPEHVLVASDPWQVSGVIDFGDAMVGDPALDVAGFPERMAQVMVTTGGGTPDPTFWARRDMYQRAAPLHAIAAGLELGRPDLVAAGQTRLRELWAET